MFSLLHNKAYKLSVLLIIYLFILFRGNLWKFELPITMFSSNKPLTWLDKEKKWMSKCKDISRRGVLPELPNEIWVDIMCKLPIKPLHICKCVSKTWYSHVTQILNSHRGLELPPLGILFEILRFPSDYYDIGYIEDDKKLEFKLGYLSLDKYKITKWLRVDGTESAALEMTQLQNTHHHGNGNCNCSGLLLGNLTFEFGSFSNAKGNEPWNIHRGLILSIVDSHTYHVYNPATKEAFVLPKSPSQVSKNQASHLAAIINFSDCLSSTGSNYRVIRCYKEKGMISIEVYSSYKHEWHVSVFPLERAVYKEKWNVSSAVVLNNTLFFMTNKKHVVAVQFHSCEQISLYSLHLPRRISRGFCESKLDVSQESLYLSYPKGSDLWIWKHDGISTDADAWIPQLIFKKSGISLCQPVVEKFLRQMVSNGIHPNSMIIHPEAPVVFICGKLSIFAFHLLNDTVEKIAELLEREVPMVGCAYMYSPCFASLKSRAC